MISHFMEWIFFKVKPERYTGLKTHALTIL